jgi:uncharacterized protein
VKAGAKACAMKQNTRVRSTMLAALAIAAGAGGFAWAEDVSPQAAGPGAMGQMTGSDALGQESGTPPPAVRLRAVVANAWDDAIGTWKRLLQAKAGEIETVQLSFVTHLSPADCYGLYTGDGPVYCSGNQTVFVGTDAGGHLMSQFGSQGEAGITFLIGHEIGHHIQNVYGRFQLLNRVLAQAPASRTELARRFELEADCLAGVWIRASHAWANSPAFRSDLLEVLKSIGDDGIIVRAGASTGPVPGVHGTSEQRTRWFTRGLDSGDLDDCDAFRAASL